MADKKYTLTFAMSDGTEKSVQFTVPEGPQGPQGIQGESADAVMFTPQNLTCIQKAQARENIHATTIKEVMDKTCPSFAENGVVVICEPVEGYPLEVISEIVSSQGGYSEVKLTRSGKNLWTLENEIIIQEDPNSGWRTIYGLPVGVPLTVSADITKYADDTATNTRMTFSCYYADGTKDWVFSEWANEDAERDGITRKKTATITPNPDKTVSHYEVALVDYSDATGARNAKAENIQIEVGTTATAYEPYKGDTFTMDLGQEVYGGSLNWNTGILTDSDGNAHQLAAQEITALSGVNTLYSDTGDTEVTGRADPVAIINNLQDRLAALEAAVVNNA